MPEIYGPVKKQKMSGKLSSPDIRIQDERRLLGVAIQAKLAHARAEATLARAEAVAKLARAEAAADVHNFMISCEEPIDDVFQLTPPVTRILALTREVNNVDDVFVSTATTSTVTDIPEVYIVDDAFESTPPTSTVTIKATILKTPQKSATTKATILTTPQKSVNKRSVSPVRAGNKLDYLRYQSPVKPKVVPVGVMSPSIKDTLRRVYPPTVQQQVRFPVVKPRTIEVLPFNYEYETLSDGRTIQRSPYVKDVLRRLHEREEFAQKEEQKAAQMKTARQARRDELSAAFKARAFVKLEVIE